MKKRTTRTSILFDTAREKDKNTINQIYFLGKVYNTTTTKGLIAHIVDLLYNKNK